MAINGFSTCNDSANGPFRVPGTARALRLRREVAPLLLGFAGEFHEKVEPINGTADDWGYNCRPVRGRTNVSFHAAGIAIDLNATRHPLGRTGTFNTRQVATIHALCRKYGLRWGGDFRGRKDPMHFEVIVSRSTALDMVRRLQTPPRSTTVRIVKPRLSKLKWKASNSDVVLLQKRLKQLGYDPGPSDGVYGLHTRNAVKAYERHIGVPQEKNDGIIGPWTLDRLFS